MKLPANLAAMVVTRWDLKPCSCEDSGDFEERGFVAGELALQCRHKFSWECGYSLVKIAD